MARERQMRRLGPRERVALAWTAPVQMRTRVWRSAWRTLAVLAVLVGLPFLAAWLNRLVWTTKAIARQLTRARHLRRETRAWLAA